jgi:hypothetical protein
MISQELLIHEGSFSVAGVDACDEPVVRDDCFPRKASGVHV